MTNQPANQAKVNQFNPEKPSDLRSNLVGVAAAFFIIWCVIKAEEFLIPLCVASLLAMLMAPLVRLMKRARVPELVAVSLTVILLYLPLIGLASLVLLEADSLMRNWPTIYESAKTTFDHFMSAPLISNIRPSDYIHLDELQSRLSHQAGEGAAWVLAGLKTILAAGTTTLLVLSFAAIMLFSREHLRRAFEGIIAAEKNPESARTLDGALGVLEKFLLARVIIILFVAAADFIILKLFGVPYAVTLAAVLGISTLVPVIGFFIGILPPLIVAVSMGHSFVYIAGLTAAIFAVSSAQDHFLTPALIGKKLNLNFLATYFAIFAGEQMWGLWGMFLSIPALGLLRVLLAASDTYRPWARLLEEEGSESDSAKVDRAIQGGVALDT